MAEEDGRDGGKPPSGWDEARRAHLRQWLSSTPAQRLAWLEEMRELALAQGARPPAEILAKRHADR